MRKGLLILSVILLVLISSGCTTGGGKNFPISVPQVTLPERVPEFIVDLKDFNLNLDDVQKDRIKVNTAIKISKEVKRANLKELDLKKIETFEDYHILADNINLGIEIINENIGTEFEFLGTERGHYQKFSMEITRYAPLVNNYNEFIKSCYELDPDDEDSVNKLYIKGATFSIEATLIFTGTFYGISFATTGQFATTSGLTQLASVCSPCVSAVMSSVHWYIRNYLVEKTSDTFENTISGEYNVSEKVDYLLEKSGEFIPSSINLFLSKPNITLPNPFSP